MAQIWRLTRVTVSQTQAHGVRPRGPNPAIIPTWLLTPGLSPRGSSSPSLAMQTESTSACQAPQQGSSCGLDTRHSRDHPVAGPNQLPKFRGGREGQGGAGTAAAGTPALRPKSEEDPPSPPAPALDGSIQGTYLCPACPLLLLSPVPAQGLVQGERQAEEQDTACPRRHVSLEGERPLGAAEDRQAGCRPGAGLGRRLGHQDKASGSSGPARLRCWASSQTLWCRLTQLAGWSRHSLFTSRSPVPCGPAASANHTQLFFPLQTAPQSEPLLPLPSWMS